MDQPPFLHDLFERARRELKLPLSTGEYFALLRAVEHGYGLVGKDDLRQLCETLWLKDQVQRPAFFRFFEAYMTEEKEKVLALYRASQREQEANKSGQPGMDPNRKERKDQKEDPRSKEEQKKQKDTLRGAAVSKEEEQPQVWLTMGEGEGGLSFDEDSPGPESILSHRYLLTNQYHAVSERQMQQSWRFLRYKTETGFTDEIDLPATVERVARIGMFYRAEYQKAYANKIRLALLIDHRGSMVAFHSLGEQLIETARRGGGQVQVEVLYFHNYPEGKLYTRPDHTRSLSLANFYQQISGKYTGVLIFSDGGSARGGYNPVRFRKLWSWLDELKERARHVVWINPMPRERWAETTAEYLARLVPMYEANEGGFRSAIKILRGKELK